LGHYAFGLESAIGSSYNFAPQLFLGINKAIKANNVAKARELQLVVTNLFEILFKNGNPGLVQQKVAMKMLTGIDLGPARFPQLPMSPAHEMELEADLKQFKIQQYHV
jgi:N-acetylneuraminate lyase